MDLLMSSVADVARLLDPAGWLSLTLPPRILADPATILILSC